jgi:hypothetical protein
MNEVANKPLRRTLRLAARATSAGMLCWFGVTLDGSCSRSGTLYEAELCSR